MIFTHILLYFSFLFSFANTSSDFFKNSSHPFYVSVTQIEEKPQEKILEVSCKIFTDDFEKTLRTHYDHHIDLLNPVDKSAMNHFVNDYFQQHLKISVDGRQYPLQFVGYEKDEEGVECYFQVSHVSVKKTVSVFNNLLFEYKPEQTNIVHVTVKHNRKSRQLINPENTVTFNF